MQSTGVWSLTHDITTSLGLSPTQISNNPPLPMHRYNNARVDPHAHSQHINVLQHFVYI